MNYIPFFPPEASTVAQQVDLLMLLLLALGSFFTLGTFVLISYFGIKYRRGKLVDRSDPPSGSTKMELSWMAGMFALSVVTFTWAAVLYLRITSPPKDSLEVSVVALQWMWKFQHPGGQQEIDELHVPVGAPVRLTMTSQDVIHSFYVPDFRVKYDVIPGRYTTLWFEATKTGEYKILCAEYCGTGHSQMRGTVIVMQPHAYQDWLSGGQAGETTAQAGGQIYQQLGCAGCHDPSSGVQAPSLEGLFGSQVELQSGQNVTADENYIRESILTPQKKIVAGYQPIMPTFEGRITEEQILELIAYIKSLGQGSSQGGS
jgi:cytochrome c oxidase subunit 2